MHIREKIKETQLALLSAFAWSDTEKGRDYWLEVYNQLENELMRAKKNGM